MLGAGQLQPASPELLRRRNPARLAHMSNLAILHTDELGDWESSLFALASFLGIDARYVCVTTPGFGAEQLRMELAGAKAVAMSAATLCVLEDRDLSRDAFEKPGGNGLAGLLIYGYQPDNRHEALANRLTGLAVSSIEPIREAGRCSFPRASRAHARQLAGCDFEREPSPADCSFRLETGPGVETLMEVSGKPVFIRTTRTSAPWFHWTAVDAIANPGASSQEDALPRRCDRLVPPIMFLRAVFPDSCWENPVKIARVIIDDPLLERTYGYLRYDDLVDSLAKLRYGVTTAFIPWNYRRTTRRAAGFFAAHVAAHSICVHGCDHTNNEFGVTDENMLRQKAVVALDRMEQHRERTGIACDAVMVFPQGRFSSAAMRALRQAGFLAVVNSTRQPTDSSANGSLLGEELLPATNRHSGLPIFTRRYPKELSVYALDLFLGKPAFIVEHHQWFAQGCQELERCVQFLKEVEPELSWPPLSDGLQRQHLRRRGNDGSRQIRFFTPNFEFENPDSIAGSFVFTKTEPEPCLLKNVTVDGECVPFVYNHGLVTFQIELRAQQKVVISLNDARPAVSKTWIPSLEYRAKVGLRRVLSEVRDNHLVKHPGLLAAARRILRKMKWSSEASATRTTN